MAGCVRDRAAMPHTVADAVMPSSVQPPTIVWLTPDHATPDRLSALPCPNCGSAAKKAMLLTVDVQLPDNPSKQLHVLHCPTCDCRFYNSQVPPDYAEPGLNDRGRVPFYVQQGAGVSLITRPLAQASVPAGSAYMEVGCGYGFGLDYALNTRGWHGIGIDPAPLAALGRGALNLPIELRYLRDDDEARGTMDVVLGSEVIEHVTSPSVFVRTLRAMLKPGGLLILTTPNGSDIRPGVPPGIIIPLLSPSLHLVIQTTGSLRALLHQAGFAHVDVSVDSHSLVAFASDAPLAMERDEALLRRALRTHLLGRAERCGRGTDMFLGFAGRAFQECVNDADMAGADRAWAMLVPACQTRFGLDLQAPTLPEELRTCSLERMAELVPLNLGGLLYAYGIRQIVAGMPRQGLEGTFALAATAAAAMRRALGELAMEDGQTEDIGWTAAAEALLCAASNGAADLHQRLAALPPAPNGGKLRRRSIAQRALGLLVNAGHYGAARKVAHQELAGVVFDEPLSVEDRDALFAMAILDLQADDETKPDPARAIRRFAQVRSASPPGGELWWAACRGELQAHGALGGDGAAAMVERLIGQLGVTLGHNEVNILVNAGRYDMARKLVRQHDLDKAAFAQPDYPGVLTTAERDNLFFLAVIGAQGAPHGRADGDPVMARKRFERVRDTAEPGGGLWWGALQGELQAIGLMKASLEAEALIHAVQKQHPDLVPPDHLRARFAAALT